jgi:hypothetical protein
MGMTWQVEAKFRAEIRELRRRLYEMDTIREAAQAVARAPDSVEAMDGLRKCLNLVGASAIGSSALNLSVADGDDAPTECDNPSDP